MSKFHHYAADFDAAFKTYRNLYSKSYYALESAKDAENKAVGEVARLTARAKRIEAENTFKTVSADVLQGFNRTRDELSKALKEEVEAACVVDPAQIDSNTCILLDSGMLKPSDYAHLAEKFSGNTTMCRLIGAKAAAAAQNTDQEGRAILNNVRTACESAGREPLEAWNALVETSRYCTGQRYDGDRSAPKHVVTMAERWEDFTSEAVEAF